MRAKRPQEPSAPRARHAATQLIAPLIFATLLLACGAVWLRYQQHPPYYRGWYEVTARQSIAGWAINRTQPYVRVEVQLFVDGRFVAHALANHSRPDVPAAGQAPDEWCGYDFQLPLLTAGRHEARVYVLHRAAPAPALQLLGQPVAFDVDAAGALPAEGS